MVQNILLNSERYLFLSRARLVADDADNCSLEVVSYYTCNWQNAGNNTPLQISAHPNLTQYRKLIVVLEIIRRDIPIGSEKSEKKISKIITQKYPQPYSLSLPIQVVNSKILNSGGSWLDASLGVANLGDWWGFNAPLVV